MKRKWLLSLMLLGSGSLFANDATILDAVRFQYYNYIAGMGQKETPIPYGIMATGDIIGNSPLEGDRSQHSRYSEAEANLLYSLKTDSLEGITFEAGAGNTSLHWNQNPFFNETSFNYINLGFLGYSGAIGHWFWQAGFGTHLNESHGNDILDYSRWIGFLWGRYPMAPNFGFHVGTLTLTGIQKTVTYPIIGFDWTITKKWELRAIFPVDMELMYLLTDRWTFAAFIRPFLTRQRVGNNEPVPRAIFEYRNAGAELNISYEYMGLYLSVFGGYTFAAVLKVMDQDANNPQYFDFGSAPYGGFNALWAF